MTSTYYVTVNFPIDCTDMTVAELKNEADTRFHVKAYIEHWTVRKTKVSHIPEQATIRVDAIINAPTPPAYTTFEI